MAEDRDIKIYEGGKSCELNDIQRISEDIDRNKRNGNIDKAKLSEKGLQKFAPTAKSSDLILAVCLRLSFIACVFC